MQSVFQKVQAQFWETAVHTTSTTRSMSWEDTLIHDAPYVYFSDIDYTCQNMAVWDTINHLRRMQQKLLSEGKSCLQDAALMADMRAALQYWLDKDFQNPNWWYNQIGMVSNLAAVTIMLYDVLSPEERTRAAQLLQRGSVAGTPAILKWEGANLIWGIRDTIYHALVIGDGALMRVASDRIAQEIAVAPALECGIKADMSFYQHGPLLYSCGYGRSFTYETAQLLCMLSGSEFAVAEDKVALFEDFVLDGQRYMMRGPAVDYQAVGREIARPNALSSDAFAAAAEFLLNTDGCRRREELKQFHGALTGAQDCFASTKYFPCSYYLSHKTPAFHMSVKGYHTHYKGTEWGLNENRLGYNLNCGGVTTFMASGKEYYNLSPVWDYAAIPGTTAPAWEDATLWEHSEDNWKSKAGTNDDCGGFSDGSMGALYMRLDHDGFSGYKAYFAYEDGMVCMGCAIDGPEMLYTTVDQAFRQGELFEKQTLQKGQGVVNGGFCYINLSDAPMTAEAKKVTGAWVRNSLSESAEPVEGNVFLAQIQGAAYAYAVTAQTARDIKIARIVNTPAEQSVTFTDGRRLAVIRQDGKTHILSE